jgi:glycosyltransferase involved in cell wall biosynthesis
MMKDVPLVSFYTNSYNRLLLLKNLLKSFELCNQHPNVEWIITDYGSTDGSREFIQKYSEKSDFRVKYLFADENDYFSSIDKLGIPIDDRWWKFRALLAKYRNDAKELSQGEYIFDVGSDHQFIRRGLWIEEVIEIFRNREEAVGKDDISCIVNYGYPRWRYEKPNNARSEEKNTESVPYYMVREKVYVDYGVMKRSTLERIGKFLEPSGLQEGTIQMNMWKEKNAAIQPEAEYERRCRQAGLKRVFMKYPILGSFKNDEQATVLQLAQDRGSELLASLWTMEDIEKRFNRLKRPVSSDELGVILPRGAMRWWLDRVKDKFVAR